MSATWSWFDPRLRQISSPTFVSHQWADNRGMSNWGLGKDVVVELVSEIPGIHGLVKAKKYDWKDSNMALFGSDTEKRVKKESAESEPAWQGSGQDVGLRIWRINKFKVEDWPKEQYGEFFMGDSYIILNTYKDKESDELLYDVHFWIGQESTQDEYGTAAYKTVELDTYHDDKPVQHREVQEHESSLFKSYFQHMKLLKGGADTGFRKVKPTEYRPRLLRFQKTGRSVKMVEVSRSRSNMTSGDVFILDHGTHLYQWNGKDCNKDEKFSVRKARYHVTLPEVMKWLPLFEQAVQYMQKIDEERNGRVIKEALDEEDMSDSHPFYNFLDEEDDGDEQEEEVEMEPKLFKVSDEDGSLDRDFVKEGEITMEDFDSNDVMIIDSGKEVTVWVGRGASDAEQKNGLPYAHEYLKTTSHPLVPVTVVKEGQSHRTIPGVA